MKKLAIAIKTGSVMLALLLSGSGANAQNKLALNEAGYLEKRGVNVLVFSNRYGLFGDEKASGVEIIQHGIRTATNGDVRLNPTPEQWDSIPRVLHREVRKEMNRIDVSLRYVSFDFDYRLQVEPLNEGVVVRVTLDKPLPQALSGKAGFNLEFLPASYFHHSYLADGRSGIFPLYPSGPMSANEGRTDPMPLATARTWVLSPEDPTKRVTIRSSGEPIALYDGRNKAQNGWFVARSLIPSNKTGTVVEWFIEPHAIANWTRPPVIAHSQAGYHPSQKKVAVIELDKNDQALSEARLLKVNETGEFTEALRSPVKKWGNYLRYQYYEFDFTWVKAEGTYILQYGSQQSYPFPISKAVFENAWHPTLDVFFPVQMDHMFVNEAYRVWHGRSHMDDALQAPVNHPHFDLYAQGPTTDTRFKPGEHIPGLAVGGWFDAGDFDLRTQTIYATVQNLVQTWESFKPLRDETWIDQSTGYVDIHHPDGKPDILQQVEHGTLFLLAQQKAVGYAIHGIVEAHLHQYTHLGDASTKTDNLVYNPKLGQHESDGFSSGNFDDRWAFTSRSSALNYGAAAGLAAASRALKGFNDTLSRQSLQAARKIWIEENSHAPYTFRHGNTTGGPLPDEKLRAALELLLATGEQAYKDSIAAKLSDFERQFGRYAQVIARSLPHMDATFKEKMRQAAAKYNANLDQVEKQNPFGVIIGTGGWAGSGQVIGFASTNYVLHKAFPDLVGPEHVFRGLNYIYGCHPGSSISLVSGVGTRSKEVAYGNNRADFSFIAGGIVPGVLIVPPDFPENKEDWPFIWGENEYVINLGASYIFLVHAVNDLVNGNK